MYALSTYDSVTKSDLPLLFRYTQAKRHDSISGIVALAELREVSPELLISNICFDSANDNYPTYELLKEWCMNPFIDLNGNRGKTAPLPKAISITDKGIPICMSGNEIIYNSFCKSRSCHKWPAHWHVAKLMNIPTKINVHLLNTGE